jgi:AcrR family transcriptional regulator
VGAPEARDRPDSRDRLLLAAERLIAERGMDVPLRDVAAAAGQRNNSAVHYYFGSRDGLIQAVIERRQEPLEARRLKLLAEHEAGGHADDVRALLTILIEPMAHLPYEDGATHYARFLEQVRTHPLLSEPVTVGLQNWPGSTIVVTRLGRALAHLSPEVRRHRIESMATVMFALMADQERRADLAGIQLALDFPGIDDILTMLVGLLTAQPPS